MSELPTNRRAIWAVVPVKAFAQSKTRLAPALSAAERSSLARATFEHVLSVLAAVPELSGVLVATECPEVAALATGRASVGFHPANGEPLRLVVDRALAEVAARGAGAAIVLMADLPWLAPDEVSSIAAALERADAVLVPDEREDGSNGIALAVPAPFPTAFAEPASFSRHRELATTRGLAIEVARGRGLAFDVDRPADLARLRASVTRAAEPGPAESGSAGRA